MRRFITYILFTLFTLASVPAIADDDETPVYDEVPVTLNIPRLGNWEIQALIVGNSAYLPVKDLFDILLIKNEHSADMDSISGYIINPNAPFVIDGSLFRIVYQGKTFDLNKIDFIRTDNNLFMRSDHFGTIFGLECSFNFRSLSVTLTTKLELPAIRELQLEQMRKNITQLKGDKKADTIINRQFSIFKLGMADWSLLNVKDASRSYTRIGAILGGIFAGGETNVYLNYTSGEDFKLSKQNFRWRYVDNNSLFVKQVTAGNLYVQPTASIYGPIRGVEISNAPTTYRRSFGTYKLSNKTEPGWMVELYVNNILVNYTKADPSGFFSFDVPLVYGTSNVKLRFFGPWGEESTKEQNINIPFNFLPANQFEYTASAGIVDDVNRSKFARVNLNYGLGRRLTVGGGMEYLSTVTSGKAMPYVTSSMRLGQNLLISAEHTYGVRSKGTFNYRLPSSLQFEVNYTKYAKGQTAIKSGMGKGSTYLEDRKAVLFIPIRTKKFIAFSRMSFSQLVVPNMTYTTAEWLTSTIFKGISTSLTTSAVYSNPKFPLVYSNLSLSLRLPKMIRITPQIQYEYNQKNFSMMKCEFEKNISTKGFMILSYEKNIEHKTNYFSLGLRYNFSFAQAALSITKGDDRTTIVQSARGSLLYNDESKKMQLNAQSNIGRGALIMIPFLDLNGNHKLDAGEPRISNLKMRINGGRLEKNKKDTSITITGLEAFTNYFIEFDKNSLDNIGWQLLFKSMNVMIEPNHFKRIEVPVTVVGEASGYVLSKGATGNNGIGGVYINFYNSDSLLVAKTLSESDGYFSFVGLMPGNYTARIDEKQLANLKKSSTTINIVVKVSLEGDVVDGLKFLITDNENK